MDDKELNPQPASEQKDEDAANSAVPENTASNANAPVPNTAAAPGAYPAAPYPYGYYPPYPSYYSNPYKRKEQDEILGHVASRQSFAVVLLCWVFGILFADIFVRGGFGLSVPLLMAVFYVIVIWYFSKKERKPRRSAYVLLIPIGLLSLGYLFHDNGMTYFLNTLLLMALVPLQLSLMSGTSAGSVFSAQSVYHTLVSTVARPLAFLDAPFKAISRNIGKGNKSSRFVMIFLGLIIALPIAGIFTVLFINADSAFGYFVQHLFSKIDVSVGTVFFDVVFGTIAALFLSAWLITMRARKEPEEKAIRLKIGVDGLLAATVLAVVNLVQIAFVAVQFGYLFAGMSLPAGMTYSTYARSGFFELCAVLCISVCMILLCMIFVQKNEKKRLPKSVSLMLTVFIVCNYVIVASAVYRMLAYIAACDLSVKRVMVTWLIVLFALCMLGAAIKIWNPKFPVLSYVAIVVIAMTVAVNTVNVNALVADYNVDSYISSLQTSQVRKIDIGYLGDLGPSASKATYRLYQEGRPADKSPARAALLSQKSALQWKSWKNFSLSDMQAHQYLDGVSK